MEYNIQTRGMLLKQLKLPFYKLNKGQRCSINLEINRGPIIKSKGNNHTIIIPKGFRT
jgi:hypothetical protein